MAGSQSTLKERGGDLLYQALVDAEIDTLIGLPGTQTLPLDRTVAQRDEMTYVMARHETAIPHIAWGYYESSGNVAATLTVPGPGDTNSMHGLKNALDDCVPIIHISADSDPADRGKGPIHEIDPNTYDNVVKANLNVETEIEFLETVKRGIAIAQTPPYGPVRLGVPSGLLAATITPPDAHVTPGRSDYDIDAELDEAIEMISRSPRPVVYVGGGARRSPGGPDAIRDLVETLDAPVFASYKGKGVFPEDDPRFTGVTARYLPAGAKRVLSRADTVLALGTDFDGVTTSNWALPMGENLIHVTLDPNDVNAAYSADVAIVGDVSEATREISRKLSGLSNQSWWDGTRIGDAVRAEYRQHLADEGLLDDEAPAKTPGVLCQLRDVIPRESIVTTGIGGHRLWANAVFEAYGPNRYITAGSWAGMGVGLPSAIGAKLARPDSPVVCLTGDGGFLMCLQELHTAVEEELGVVVVVFNNSDYGIISKSPKINEYTRGQQFSWDSPDYVGIAESFGARGTVALTPGEARSAVETALAADGGPVVIDVQIQTDEPSVDDMADYDSAVDLP